MARVIFNAAIFLSVLAICLAEENLQKWSIFTKLDVPLTLWCNDTSNQINVSSTDNLVWSKKDHEGVIETGPMYTLSDDNRMLNFTVTDETSGIYFCEVTDAKSTADPSDDELVGVIAKGVNVRVHDYDDFLDKYERNLIVGAIAAGSVLFLVVALGLLNNFQYKSEEQLEKRRQRKADRLQRQQEASAYNGYDNKGVAMDNMPGKNENIIIYTGGDQYRNGTTKF